MKQLTFPDGREVSYELTRKRVKNVNLRVQTDGTLHISANARVPISEIERFILANESFIISAAERLQQREQRSEVSVESVHWLGREYPVRVIVNSRECAILEEDELRVFTRAQTPEEAEEIVRRWLSDRFMELIRELNAEVLRGLSEGGLTPPKTRITIKDMSTRWGSCSYSRDMFR